ncbi:hypothetical protein ACFW93_44515 [Streptomyces canus]|uniref:hypothetical protein n=1 Tax=Streptomyces canus TaxID=58343 RepID=UPI0036A56C16
MAVNEPHEQQRVVVVQECGHLADRGLLLGLSDAGEKLLAVGHKHLDLRDAKREVRRYEVLQQVLIADVRHLVEHRRGDQPRGHHVPRRAFRELPAERAQGAPRTLLLLGGGELIEEPEAFHPGQLPHRQRIAARLRLGEGGLAAGRGAGLAEDGLLRPGGGVEEADRLDASPPGRGAMPASYWLRSAEAMPAPEPAP